MAATVLEFEGTWEEVRAHDADLMGQRVRLVVLGKAETTTGRTPNYVMLDAMRKAEEIQVGMNPKSGGDAVTDIRIARAGAMYGDDSTE